MRDNGKKIQFAGRSRSTAEISDPSIFIGLALGGDAEKFKDYMESYPEVINLKDKDHGNVALHVASSKGNLEMASMLLRRGANVNVQDIFGNSPLHYAADKKKKEMAELLIKCGADVNLKDFRGNTALHTACVNNDIDMVRMLLLANADPNVSDLADMKPSQKTTSPPIKALLERRIQSLHSGDEDMTAKIMSMMTFGIGLGVGLGMAMAKSQQFQSERVLRHQLRMSDSKGKSWKASGMGDSMSSGSVMAGQHQLQQQQMVPYQGNKFNNNSNNNALVSAGALVVQQPHSGGSAVPAGSSRKLL
jgi:hypothetical protein